VGFFVNFTVKNKCDDFRWVLMVVYGAAQPEHKDSFLAEFVNTEGPIRRTRERE
jgi:hypothetical protein